MHRDFFCLTYKGPVTAKIWNSNAINIGAHCSPSPAIVGGESISCLLDENLTENWRKEHGWKDGDFQ